MNRFGKYFSFSFFLKAILIAVFYFFAAKFGLTLATINNNTSPVWPATGVAIACLSIFGTRYFISIFVAAFFVNTLAGSPLQANIGIAIGNALEAVVAVWILKNSKNSFQFESKAITFLAAAFCGSSISATIGAISLLLSHRIEAEFINTVWITWWLGDVLGALVIAPFLIQVLKFKPLYFSRNYLKLFEGICLFIITFCVALILFRSTEGIRYLFILFPLILWAVVRLGSLEAEGLALLISCLAILETINGFGPFQGGSINDRLIFLQLFLASISITVLFLNSFKSFGSIRYEAIAVLFVGWALSGALFYAFHMRELEKDRLHFDALVNAATESIQAKIEVYDDALRGGVGLMAASQYVDQQEWKAFTEGIKIIERHPGLNGMGFIEVYKKNNLKNKISQIPNIPDSERPVTDSAYIIKYIEPLEPNIRAQGVNIASEENRFLAANLARDTGKATVTDRIILVQDELHRDGFLYLIPVYKNGASTTTLEERQKAHVGWIYAPFVLETFIAATMTHDLKKELTYVVDTDNNESLANASFEAATSIKIGQQIWSMKWNRAEEFVSVHDSTAAWAAFLGSLVTLFLVGFIISFQSIGIRARRIADEKTSALKESEARLIEAKDAALAGLQVRSQFLATMSHEIRTPLNGIIGMTDLLLETELSDSQRKFTKIAQESGQNLLTIVNDILDFSKIEANKLEFENVEFSPIAVVENQTEIMTQKIQSKNLKLLISVDPKVPSAVLGDSGRLSQVLINLIGNAIKFTEKGIVLVSVAVEDFSDSSIKLKFAIKDTGIGIKKEKLGSLFMPFTQADASTARKYGGTGLGLSICKNLVELMKGKIWVETQEGEGSIFYFTAEFGLPLNISKADRLPTFKKFSKENNDNDISVKGRILIAEDNSANQILALTYLKQFGYSAQAVANGFEAVVAAETGVFDIILMDCQMPEMDGFEATKKIRSFEVGSKKRVCIVALTANAMKEDRDSCLLAGMDDYLSKPFKKNELLVMIEKWMKKIEDKIDVKEGA